MLEQLTRTENLSVACATSLDDVRALRRDWLDLEAVAPGATLFQTWHWCDLALRQIEQRNQAGAGRSEHPFVLSIKENDRLIALLPLKIIQKPGRRILTGLAEPFQEFSDILVAPHANATAIFARLLPILKKAPADYLHFGQVREDSRLYEAIKEDVPGMGERDGAPYVDLRPFDGFAAYHSSLNAKTRKNMRNRRNRLAKTGAITHELTQGTDDLQALVARTFDNRSEWLAARGLTSSSFEDGMFADFLTSITQANGTEGGFGVMGMTLRQGDTILAEQWGPVAGGRYYAFMSGWNKDFIKASPGAMHLEHVVSACFDGKLERAEFLLPVVPYKSTWATHCVAVQDHILPLNVRGWLFAHLWFDRARPALKRFVYALSPPIRRVLTLLLHPFKGH